MVGGATGAAMTSIVMIFEMTLDYSVVLPMTITVAISYGVRKLLSKESIYTEKLARRGHSIPDALRASIVQQKTAGDIMDERFVIVQASITKDEFIDLVLTKEMETMNFLVADGDAIIGLVTREAVSGESVQGKKSQQAGDLALKDNLLVSEKLSILRLLSRIISMGISFVIVTKDGGMTSPGDVRGIITKERLAEFVSEAAEQFSP